MHLNTERLRALVDKQGMSQVELARKSGVSRQRLISIMKLERAHVRQRTAAKLASALGVSIESLDADSVVTSYLTRVAAENGHLDLTGLAVIRTGLPIPLERGFACISVKYPVVKDPDQPERTKERDFSLDEAMMRERRFFLLGGPGSGKTTALRHIALAYATGQHEVYGYPSQRFVPIYVRLAAWAEMLRESADVDVVAAALSQLGDYENVGTADWLRRQVLQGNAILLLDGLDEIADPDLRDPVIEALRSSATNVSGNRVMITSREIGFEPPALGTDLRTLRIQPLSSSSISAFISEWLSFRDGHEATFKCRDCERTMSQIVSSIQKNAQIGTLAGNPMMLTILLLLNESGATLPHRRWDLYRKITEALLFCWEEKKRASMAGTPDKVLPLENREVLWVLESIAVEMQRNGLTIAPRWWLSRHINSFLRDELSVADEESHSICDTLMWSLQERSVLLVERAPELFSFSHLLFQEYFASCAILSEPDPLKAVRPFVYDPRWLEVVLFVAAQIDRHRAPKLARIILDDPDPTGRDLHRGLIIVLRCMVEGAHLHGGDLYGDLKDEIELLGRTKWLGITLDVVSLLGRIKGTRLDAFADESVKRLLLEAKTQLPRDSYFRLLTSAETSGLIDLEQHKEERVKADMDEPRPVGETIYRIDDFEVHVTTFAVPSEYSTDWIEATLKQYRESQSREIRLTCILELSVFVDRSEQVRNELITVLESDDDPTFREFAATALGNAVSEQAVKDKLWHALRSDSSSGVRATCALVLGEAAVEDDVLTEYLLDILKSDPEVGVRAGCALGLKHLSTLNERVYRALFEIAEDDREEVDVWVACMLALESILPSSGDGRALLIRGVADSQNSAKARVCAQIIAENAAASKISWKELPVEKAEHVLISEKDPEPRDLRALRGLLDAREQRRLGVVRETRIANALDDVRPSIRVAFIFGSAARGDQKADSDIDLLVVGDISLESVAPGLRRAEMELGKQINAIVYSPADWRRLCIDREPFIKEVLDGEKIFIFGGNHELAALA